MIDAETNYLPLEKIGLALVTAAKKLPQYFQAHTIYVVTQHPIQTMFKRADFTVWISKWGQKLLYKTWNIPLERPSKGRY